MNLRVVFAGTPEFAVPSLRRLLALAPPLAVYTQPDRPAGRGRQLQPSAVKQCALAAGVEVRQPHSLRLREVQAALAELQPDLLVVVAYGLLLPASVLALPRFGCWNVHASLLPRWRGAAPIQRAIEAGDDHTGVCLMQMERGLDTGPVLLQRATPIGIDETAGALHDRLAELGGELLAAAIEALRAGRLPPPQPQDDAAACYARKLDKAEALLDWRRPASELARKVRAFSPWPVAEVEFAGERLRVHRAEAVAGVGTPGDRLPAARGRLEIACGEGALRLLQVQRPGGRPLSAQDYLNGLPPAAAAR